MKSEKSTWIDLVVSGRDLDKARLQSELEYVRNELAISKSIARARKRETYQWKRRFNDMAKRYHDMLSEVERMRKNDTILKDKALIAIRHREDVQRDRLNDLKKYQSKYEEWERAEEQYRDIIEHSNHTIQMFKQFMADKLSRLKYLEELHAGK